MKAILCTHLGGPDDLVLTDMPVPSAGAGECVVKIEAIGLNFYDTLIIAGRYQAKPALPFSPGGEFAGVVDRIGPGVTGVKPGDRVLGYISYGATREYVSAPVEKLVPLTADLDPTRAAGLNITYGTTYHALKDRAALKPGETLAVLGASGGVGVAAIELGKLMGARVIACASTDAKLAFARAHGADELVNYAKEDLKDALKRLGGQHGIDVVYDPIGGPYSEAAVRALAWEGRHVVIGFASGEIPKLPLNLTLLKGCSILGVHWGTWVQTNPQTYRANLDRLAHWAAEGKLSCHVHAVYPLAETAKALHALTDRQAMGKVIVRP